MSILLEKERRQVAKTALQLIQTGLVVNTSGNVSVRIDDIVVITPSGLSYENLEARDIMVIDMQGRPVSGELMPSSETPLHLSVYASNPLIRAVVHTHSVYATAVSTLVEELPAIHYQIADLGGPVPVVPYETFGSDDLAKIVGDAINQRSAVLLKNHGSVTVGDTVDQALARTITLEWLARVYLLSVQCGTPSIIDEEEIERVRLQKKKLGQERQRRLYARQSRE